MRAWVLSITCLSVGLQITLMTATLIVTRGVSDLLHIRSAIRFPFSSEMAGSAAPCFPFFSSVGAGWRPVFTLPLADRCVETEKKTFKKIFSRDGACDGVIGVR